jgi:hypothetical protein
VHQRLAELHTIADKRPLTPDEQVELEDCMQINADVMLELAKIKIASEQAFITSDTEWQYDICARIEAVSKKFIRGGIYSG